MKPRNIPPRSFFATRTRRLATIAVLTIAICSLALTTLSLAQTDKRIQRAAPGVARRASGVAKPERLTSSRGSDRFKRRAAKYRDQEGSGLGNQNGRERNDRGPREGKMKRGRPFNGDLRHLPQTKPIKAQRPDREARDPTPTRFAPPAGTSAPEANESSNAPEVPSAPAPPPTSSFEGLDFNTWGNGHPPATVGDVGPTYYIQAINTSVGIYDKATGNLVTAFTFNTFMSQGHFGNLCDTNNFGDPVVLYDSFEDRWIITDFAFQLSGSNIVNPPGNFQCIAASMSGDPVSGGWNFYSINTAGGLGDYPKFGIWPDGLYMSANMFPFNTAGAFLNARAYAFNKMQMYAGSPTVQVVQFDIAGTDFTVIPANARLQTGTPPPGSPNYYVVTSTFTNALNLYKFHVDWNNISLSSFTGPFLVANLFGAFPNTSPAAVPSLGGNNLDALAFRAMMQFQYTNLAGSESLWASHTVRRGNNTGFAAPRYYPIGVNNGTIAATTTQAATFDPDGANVIHRWMPSVAVDRAGNMALGYSTSSSTTKPAMKYAGRLSTDPANTITQTEQLLVQGTGTQTGNCGGAACTRWGDYSAMTLDPDGCTFWNTNMYYLVDGLNHQTRIGSFRFNQCTPVGAGGSVSGTVTVTPGGAPPGVTVT